MRFDRTSIIRTRLKSGRCGFTGQGLVIGTADTGVRWTHNALKSHYRGWNGTMANHNYNWHDSVHNGAGNPCGNNAHAPCDDNGMGPIP